MPGFYDDSIVRQVLQATDIIEVVRSYVALKPRGKEFVGLCPFHDDHKPSMYVSPAKQIYKCFSCGAGGTVFDFLMQREKMTFPEALRLLAERGGITLPTRQKKDPAETDGLDRTALEQANRWAARFFRKQLESPEEGRRAREYISGRGISDEVARRFGLGWAPASWDRLCSAALREGQKTAALVHVGLLVEREGGGLYDRFRERLMFPVLDAMGRVIAFGGRTLGDDPAKYLNSPESELFDKGRSLYGIHAAKDAIMKRREVVVVEGYTDCLMAHQHGISHVVATLGTAMTAENARVLSRYADKIILMFDSDEAGQKAAERAIDVFFEQQRVELFLAHVPEGKDPCDFLVAQGADALQAVLAQATEALEYKWRLLCRRLTENDSMAGRKQAAEDFLRFVAMSLHRHAVDAISEGLIVNRIAKLIQAPVSQVHDKIMQFGRQYKKTAPAAAALPTPVVAKDVYVNAQREVLEVLLNRPELFSLAVVQIPQADSFRDPVHRAIAEVLWPYLRDHPDGQLREILTVIDSMELTRIVTDMAERGLVRGNFEQTLAGALRLIDHEKAEAARSEVRDLIAGAAAAYGEDAETAALLEYQAKWRPDPRRLKKL